MFPDCITFKPPAPLLVNLALPPTFTAPETFIPSIPSTVFKNSALPSVVNVPPIFIAAVVFLDLPFA